MPRPRVAHSLAFVLSLFSGSAYAQTPQEIVDQFYPEQALPTTSPTERRSCLAVYQADGSGPTTILAAYTNTVRGTLRVLTRSGGGSFGVAADAPADLSLGGDTCTIELEDVDGDQTGEAIVRLSSRGGDETWIFRWTGTLLENRTPTRQEGDTTVSAFANATILDLAHDGTHQVYVNQSDGDVSETQTEANPLFVPSPSGFVVSRGVLTAARVVLRGTAGHEWATFRKIVNRPGPYTLRIVNGAPNGLGRVTGASIELNDVVIVPAGQLDGGVEFLTVPVNATLEEINRLDFDLTGTAGSFISIVIDFPS